MFSKSGKQCVRGWPDGDYYGQPLNIVNSRTGQCNADRVSITFTFDNNYSGSEMVLFIWVEGMTGHTDYIGQHHYFSHAQLEEGPLTHWTDNSYLSEYSTGNLLASAGPEPDTYISSTVSATPCFGFASAVDSFWKYDRGLSGANPIVDYVSGSMGAVYPFTSSLAELSSYGDPDGVGIWAYDQVPGPMAHNIGLRPGVGYSGPSYQGFHDYRHYNAGYKTLPNMSWDPNNPSDLGVSTASSSNNQELRQVPYNMYINENESFSKWGWETLEDNMDSSNVSDLDFVTDSDTPGNPGYYYSGRKTFLNAKDFVNNAPEPFFAYLCPNDVHDPEVLPPSDLIYTDDYNNQPPLHGWGRADSKFGDQNAALWTDDQKKQTKSKNVNAKLESIDKMLGDLVSSMPKERLDNTVFIIQPDNGTNSGYLLDAYFNSSSSNNLRSGGSEWKPGPTFSTEFDDPNNNYSGPGGVGVSGLVTRYDTAIENRRFKSSVFELGNRAPLIVYSPNNRFGGSRRVDSLVHISDIMPTILDLLDIDIPDKVDGLSFKNILTSENITDVSSHTRQEILTELFVPNGDFKDEALLHPYNNNQSGRWFSYSYVVSDAVEASDCGRFKLHLYGANWLTNEDHADRYQGFYKLEAKDGTKVDSFEFSSIGVPVSGEPYWEAYRRTNNALASALELDGNEWPEGNL
jgi:arylsulfatase A-like enzyme